MSTVLTKVLQASSTFNLLTCLALISGLQGLRISTVAQDAKSFLLEQFLPEYLR